MSRSKKETAERNYLVAAFWAIPMIAIIKWLWPRAIPFDVFSFWHSKGDFWTWMLVAWPLFACGLAINVFAFLGLLTRSYVPNISGAAAFFEGLVISAWAGFVEEVCFRWLIFLESIALMQVINFIFFGFLGFGIPHWIHMNILGPIADFTTLHYLHAYLFGHGWAVGASLLATNAFFRDGHKYQGWFGVINSWFCGMYFFWVFFTFGLLPAIVVHFVYDALIFTLAAAAISMRRDWAGV